MDKMTLKGLKKCMIEENVSILDLNWKKLNKSDIDPKVVLKWEIEHDKTHTALGEPEKGSDSPVDLLKWEIAKVIKYYSKYDWTENHIVLNLLDNLRNLAKRDFPDE